MTLASLMNQPLIVQAVAATGATNGYGEPVVGPIGSGVAVLGYLEQSTTQEFLVDRYTTVTKWTAFLPAGTTVNRLDYITFNAQQFQIDGEPWHVYNPRVKFVSHIECKLTVVNG